MTSLFGILRTIRRIGVTARIRAYDCAETCHNNECIPENLCFTCDSAHQEAEDLLDVWNFLRELQGLTQLGPQETHDSF